MKNSKLILGILLVVAGFSTNVFRVSGLTQPIYDGPIFDVHVNAGAMDENQIRAFMSNLEQVGVTKVALSGWSKPADYSLRVVHFRVLYPDRVVPSLYFGAEPYQADSSEALSVAERAYDEGFRMFGEMLLKHLEDTTIPADDPTVLKILDIAAKRHLPVLVHHDRDYDELERALEHNRNVTIIFHGWRCWWTQCDFSSNNFRRLLLKHPNLIIALDTLRFPWIGAVFVDSNTGVLRREWKELFDAMPNRFVVGSDFYDPDKDFTLDSVKLFSSLYRGMLGQLNPEVAKRIAYQNLEDLLTGKANSTSTSSIIATTTEESHETTESTTMTIVAHSNWIQTNWQYLLVAAAVVVVAGIIVTRRVGRKVKPSEKH